MFKDPEFQLHGIDLKTPLPGGHSREELLASLNWMYRKSDEDNTYKLISRTHQNIEDLEVMRHFLSQLESSDWGTPPFHFNAIHDGMINTMKRLIGTRQTSP